MDIADEVAHRALSYVAAVSRQGYELTVDDFNAYMRSPDRRVTQSGGAMLSDLLGAGSTFRSLWGSTTVEGVLEWLVRLGWIRGTDKQTVRLTSLGEAVLRSLTEQATEPDAPVLTILESNDPMAYPMLVGMLAQRGEAMLVDPYFRLESLQHVLTLTEVTRLLIGKRAELPALAAAITTLTLPRQFNVRVSDEVHDRFIVPPSGAVDHIGTSLSGAGKRLSVMTTISPPEADGVRRVCEKLWRSAFALEAAIPVSGTAAKEKPAAKPRRRKATIPGSTT